MNERPDYTPEQIAEFCAKHGISSPPDTYLPSQQFQVTSGAVRVTDPCYDRQVWCSGQLENVRNGTWHVTALHRMCSFDWDWSIKWLMKNEVTEEKLQARYAKFMEAIADDKKLEMMKIFRMSDDLEFERGINNCKTSKGRVNWLFAVHEDYKADPRFQADTAFDSMMEYGVFERAEFEVGVDSGQAGIFDLSKYPDAPRDDEWEKRFYRPACEVTLGQTYPGWSAGVTVIDDKRIGCVASSGYGDGGYSCYYFNDGKNTVAIGIVFIGDHRDYADPEEDLEEAA